MLGHEVMADRGFTVEEDLAEKNITLHIPSFLGNKRSQLTAPEVTSTRRIAEARVHVERAIERIKEFEILCGEVDLSLLHVLEQTIQEGGSVLESILSGCCRYLLSTCATIHRSPRISTCQCALCPLFLITYWTIIMCLSCALSIRYVHS